MCVREGPSSLLLSLVWFFASSSLGVVSVEDWECLHEVTPDAALECAMWLTSLVGPTLAMQGRPEGHQHAVALKETQGEQCETLGETA